MSEPQAPYTTAFTAPPQEPAPKVDYWTGGITIYYIMAAPGALILPFIYGPLGILFSLALILGMIFVPIEAKKRATEVAEGKRDKTTGYWNPTRFNVLAATLITPIFLAPIGIIYFIVSASQHFSRKSQ